MADAMMPGMGAPEMAPATPSVDQLAAFEQMRQQISPTEVNRELLATAEQADPIAVAEFKRELADLNVAPEVLDMLNTMVDEILANPGDYPAIREKYLGMGVDEELLPETFDAAIFAALNMALDEMRGQASMPPMPPQGFAKGGIASLKPMAREMAAAGRYGDTMIAHISPVEAQILRRYGGSGTINPRTGAPEFFLKKVFKSIGKAVKKFASSTVGKIVTTVALGFLLGPAAAGMLGVSSAAGVAAVSGFVGGAGSTLLGGGDLKDAIKAGAISGLAAGATTAVFKGADAFKAAPKGATSQLQAAQQAAQQGTALPDLVTTPDALTMSPFEQSIQQGVRANMAAPATATGGIDFATGQYVPPAMTAGAGAGAPVQAPTALTYTPPPSPFTTAPATAAAPATTATVPAGAYATPSISQGIGALPAGQIQQGVARQLSVSPLASTSGQAGTSVAGTAAARPPGFFESVKDAFTPGGRSFTEGMKDAFLPGKGPTLSEALQSMGVDPAAATPAQIEVAKGMMTGTIRRYAPLVGLGIAALGATGGFEEEPSQVPPGFEGMMGGQGTTGIELLARYPERYGLQLGPTQVVSSMPYSSPSALFTAGAPRRYAEGGMTERDYPRRNGAINGPGTGTSDSIPAMLSDGEFVFTAKAVRAMGDGSRRKGAKRMYALMRKLEGRANG